MPGASALPEELLALIFSHLSVSKTLCDDAIDRNHGDKPQDYAGTLSTLASLCLASKQCCRLARPLLYSTIYLDGGVDPAQGQHRLQKLVRTLVYQPMFSSYVAKLWMGAMFSSCEQWNEEDSADSSHESWDLPYEDVVDSSRAFDQDDLSRRDLLDSLRDGNQDAHVALLLALCQELRNLSITLHRGFYDTRCFTNQVLSNSGRGLDPSIESTSLALSSLRVLSMHKSPDANDMFFSNITNELQLVSLEVFHGSGLDCTAENMEYDNFVSNLRRIDLDECIVDADGLKLIMQGCSKLEDLAVVWADNCEVNFADIGTHLGRYGKCLKKLALEQFDFNGEGGGLGDLSQMTSLKTLVVVADLLVGTTDRTDITLPKSLESLDVDLAGFLLDEDFWQQLRAVAERGKSHNLQVINCGMGGGRRKENFWNKTAGYQVEFPIDA
ncbi:uncharacterized protein RCC_08315 [Ramularia collo-cygni]|uniref:Uncharacterized protein n=1 Tax=Ramularia collo-cygni TaxID=112498 RepID=A0A2D3V6W5_9PEZI|nr:uncharacterized protein RCC_08315 [Ramularia collo-cygni]CZT22445.1 uncharacterized protein RCC_08315 [Ramularia collo-cygni]